MIIVYTNMVSEPKRRNSDPAVAAWLDQQAAETLYLTATSLSELLVCIAILPKGKRREGLDAALSDLLNVLFESRILPFDQRAASVYARVFSRARTKGQVISVADAQIAAIATVHGFTVATRNTSPFIAAGVRVINPWEEG